MTGQAVLDLALAMMAETPDEEYRALALPLLNVVLAETFDVNNSILQAAGKEELWEIPTMADLKDALPYDEKLQRKAFPCGLAHKLCYDDGDMGKVSYFQSQYANAVNACARVAAVAVADVYGGADGEA